MPDQDYNYVDYMCYDAESDTQKKVCRVYLTDGKLFYEGPEAKMFKKMVDDSIGLKPFRDLGGYALLDALPHFFKGSYNYCTEIKKPYEDAEESE